MTEEPAHMEQCKKIIKIKSMDAPERAAKYLTAHTLGMLLAEPDTSTKQGRRHLTILTVLYDTAARVSEIANVRVKDVRLDTPASITLH